ncbi:NAD(P)-binding protein [Trichocladium antarcticum]|uniref:NAD(P)-binding protein n=1 Tax=Trichocladium antarcticum TaxID=1450529 RepID=A0AAN6ZHC9_9PEZI|nr:NAD(P)-binding protein [Trichocladium antarcticum]
MANQEQFNVGIVGYGLSAKIFHIPFIARTPALKLHSILQRTPTADNSAPADHPDLHHHTAIDPLLADPALDIVILCTPPNTHYPLAHAALLARKHVLVEKPFVPTAAEARDLAALAARQRRVLSVYQNRRWDADFLTVRRLLRRGALGRVVEFETHFDRLRLAAPAAAGVGVGGGMGWKGRLGMAEGGGVVYDLGTHLVDQVVVLFGVPTGVFARLVQQREGRLVTGAGEEGREPDGVTAVLSYAETGLVVYVRIGVVSVESRQVRFWVRGTEGSYHKTGLDPQEGQLRGGAKTTDAGFGREDESMAGRLCLLGEDGVVRDEACPNVEPETYLRFYELFAKAVASGDEKDVPVPASEAAQVLRVIEAIKESAKTGREVAP